jgi:4-carboxymuconolactone decarboxylase
MMLKKYADTDPEFTELFNQFAFEEVVKESKLDDRTRMMAILAALLGCQGIMIYKEVLPMALDAGVTPVEIKEIIYQSVAYLGIGRVYPYLQVANEVFAFKGIAIPQEPQGTTTAEDRMEKGNQVQVDIFGEGMRGSYASGPEEARNINRWLSANCFGDYYTRNGLDKRQREMVTFCYLLAQGGCEPQLTAHAMGNMQIGNDKEFLVEVLNQCVPYVGYPRTLNALRCVNEAAANVK